MCVSIIVVTHTHTHNIYSIIVNFRLSVFALLFVFPLYVSAQSVGLHTNVLYWATTTPNLGVDYKISSQYTVSGTIGYNAFNFPQSFGADNASNPKLHHWLVMPELKRWFCRSYERDYIGVHALYGQYNAGGVSFPSFLSKHRYKGYALGCGVSYGYQLALGHRCGLEFSLGIGYIYLENDKYIAGRCGKKTGHLKKHYFGPTKLSLSFIFYIS